MSTSYWPMAWLPPEPVHLTVHPVGCRLHLPTRPVRDEPAISFGPPEGTPPSPTTVLEAGDGGWYVHRDLGTNTSTLEVVNDGGRHRLDDVDLVVASRAVETYTIAAHDVGSARGEAVWERGLERDGWAVRTVTRTTLTADPDRFRIRASLDAYEDGYRVYSRDWDRLIPRRLV